MNATSVVLADCKSLKLFMTKDLSGDLRWPGLDTLCAYLEKEPEYFPLTFLGSGTEAWVFKTAKGTALRMCLLNLSPGSYGATFVPKDLTALFYEECLRLASPPAWLPKVYRVKFLPQGISLVEMEELVPLTASSVYLKNSQLFKMWETAVWNNESLAPAMTLLGSLQEKPAASLSKEVQLVLGFSYFYNITGLLEPAEHPAVEAIQRKFTDCFSLMDKLCKACASQLATKPRYSEIALDLHPENVMVRGGTYELVIIDPMHY